MALGEAIDTPYARSFTLATISGALTTAADPSGDAALAARAALRAAKTVADMHSRTIALAEAAGALGPVDHVRAMRVLADARLLAESACSCKRRCLPAAVLERMAGLDPEEALREADRIPDPAARGIIMARAIPRLAPADPRRAVALARQVPELHEQIETWAVLSEALAGVDPELALFAAECAEADAGFSHSGLVRLLALARLARSVHQVDPARAKKLLAAAEAAFEDVEPSHSRSLAAGELARARARFDAERGESTARQIAQPHPRAHAFLLLAEDLKADTGGVSALA